MNFKAALQLVFLALSTHGVAAQVCVPTVLQPVAATVPVSGPGCCGTSIDWTLNQVSLNPPYVSGVTPFNGYMASHSWANFNVAESEWFANLHQKEATVIYDMGSEMLMDGLAFWNEEVSFSMNVRITTSTDGVNFVGPTYFMPVDNPASVEYFNEVVDFPSVSARYVKLELMDCVTGTSSCSIGEVAFRSVPGPECYDWCVTSPASAEVTQSGPGCCGTSIDWTFNQVSLNPPYVSGTTPFDGYMASHSWANFNVAESEWFANLHQKEATIIYDMGSEMLMDGLAFWNEEVTFSMNVRVTTSTDGVVFSGPMNFMPVDNPAQQVYFNEVVDFPAVSARYVKLELTDCVTETTSCSIGEIAFRAVCAGSGQGMGDPHFETWNGAWFDFHGLCDQTFLENPNFGSGTGLTVHIRTSPRYEYSYIETAAIKIGDDILEISAWGDYFFNGVQEAEMPLMMSSRYAATHTQVNKKRHLFEVDLLDGQKLVVTTHKDIVAIKVEGASYNDFKDSVGLMGSFGSGARLARNGTLIAADDANAFGNEWQVREGEPKLFQDSQRHPQHPAKCVMPSAKSEARRLGQSIAEETAAAACSHWADNMKKQCVFDVMITGDLELAEAAPGQA